MYTLDANIFTRTLGCTLVTLDGEARTRAARLVPALTPTEALDLLDHF